jgi:hypothetical protein
MRRSSSASAVDIPANAGSSDLRCRGLDELDQRTLHRPAMTSSSGDSLVFDTAGVGD